MKNNTVIKTVDCTPTWKGIMPAIIAVLEDGTPEGKRLAKEELMDLAAKVDAANKGVRK
jgi:hypothetical protein